MNIEKINIKSFSSKEALEIYNSYNLKQIEKEIVNKYFNRKNAKILDLGCGTGRTTVPLMEMGYNVVGVDISKEMIKQAKKKFPQIDFKVGDACNLCFDENTFDYVIFSYNGLDYIHPKSKRIKALKEVYRVLKDGGYFYYSSHNSLWIPNYLGGFRIILKNIIGLNFFKNYWKVEGRIGVLFTFHENPFSQKKTLEKIGFRTVRMFGGEKYTNKLWFIEPWIHYLAQK